MILKKGNLYTAENYATYHHIGFTANSVVMDDGCLVMGGGNAKVVRDTFGGIDTRLAEQVKTFTATGEDFLLIFDNETKIFALQTKRHWRDPSPLDLVECSLVMLENEASLNKDQLFAVPMPAVGLGGVSRETILPMVEYLPDNIHIWEL